MTVVVHLNPHDEPINSVHEIRRPHHQDGDITGPVGIDGKPPHPDGYDIHDDPQDPLFHIPPGHKDHSDDGKHGYLKRRDHT